MTDIKLENPVTEIEIAEINNIEGMPLAGRDIVRRMAFEVDALRLKIKERDKKIRDMQFIGHQMANICFNLAQEGCSLRSSKRKALDEVRRAWDALSLKK